MITRRLLSLTAGCAFLAAPGAWAQVVVWDAPVDPDQTAFVDQQFPDFPDFSTYLVGHVQLDRETCIHEITTYFTNANNLWRIGDLNATLNIIEQGAGLPENDHDPSPGAGGMAVAAIMAMGASGFELTYDAAGGITLAAGEYWIGLTPDIEFGVFGQEFHQGTDLEVKSTAGRNPGGGFGVGTLWFDAGQTFAGINWAMALTITGKNADCPEDLDCSGSIDPPDLITLLGMWSPDPGSCPGCPADLDGDDDVDGADLIVLLGAWGPCP